MRSSYDRTWDREIGKAWAGLLSGHSINREGSIAEVGPGFASKIGLGLSACGFRGSLFVIEPNARALRWVAGEYRRALPEARIIPVALPIDTAAASLPSSLDALLMNHVFDDLILNEATAARNRARVFGSMRQGAPCRPEVRQTWRALAEAPDRFERASGVVLDQIEALCLRTRPAFFAASQYPSWFQYQHGLEFVDCMTAPLLERLAGRLRGNCAERWLIADGTI